MKKIIIVGLAVIFISGGTWFFLLRDSSSDKNLEENFDEIAEQIEKSPDIGKDAQPLPVSKGETDSAQLDKIQTEDTEIPERGVGDKDMDKFQAYFQKVEQAWQESMENLIVKELGKGEQAFRTYVSMREGYEQDKMEAFEQQHKELEQKYGKNYTYRPTEDEQNFSKKILPLYQDKLKKMLGDDGFKRYEDVKSTFNTEQSKNADSEIGFMQMEF
jgi:hypothetical protein